MGYMTTTPNPTILNQLEAIDLDLGLEDGSTTHHHTSRAAEAHLARRPPAERVVASMFTDAQAVGELADMLDAQSDNELGERVMTVTSEGDTMTITFTTGESFTVGLLGYMGLGQ